MSSNFHIVMNTGTCVLFCICVQNDVMKNHKGTVCAWLIAQIPVGKAQNLAQNELKFS